jgi:putative ABC transport system substrate-binding protein
LSGKRLQLLRDAVPTIVRPAILWNPESKDAALSFEETHEAAQALGLQTLSLEVRAPADFNRARQATLGARADGLIVLGDFLMRTHKAVVISIAGNARLPAMYDQALPYMDAGGLMAYGPNVEDLARRTATYVDKILKGARPADLPIERLSQLDFVINLKTARTLGLAIPQSILQQATQVIQ